ncbi:MAG: alpha-L-fucosidase [Bryobacteraceae bacterium]|nr:alpha-L-fucosidase [Bryobacterales bacterium]MEB2360788.1 alpha-L-fucosidase [Bryobacterales bacterium]NUN01369.1 alpha-L-fucosidase [Bryobacteraceae bacterium]
MRNRILLFLLVTATAFAQNYKPAPENLKAREWFQNAKFGMFIHWGVYSVLGDGEWVMNNRKMTISEYEKLPPKFNPTGFDAAEWVSLAKNAGMKYITITSKHHDGFAMWATKQSKWNIVDATPYGKDPLKMLAEECKRQGIKLFFYHSQLDWHHPDYYPLGRTGHASGRAPGGDFNRYLDYMDRQLRELLTGYGEIGGVWFDGWWDKPGADWRLDKTYSLIHSLQPAALVGSNHHRKPFDGEDFQMFEKDLPGQNTTGFSGEAEIGNLPLETCDTINGAWGYNKNDKRFKSTQQLIQYLVKAAGHNANFLLNVGPTPEGTIQPEFVERLQAIGKWMLRNGETIYGTRGGPVAPRPWGAMTQKGNRIFVHVLDWNDELLALPPMPKIKRATLFATGAAVKIQTVDGGLLLRLPKPARDPVDTIVVLEKQ